MSESIFLNTQGLYQRRRAFNMSYKNDFTCNLGEIVPVYWQDLIPNSSWHCRVHGLVRFMPLIAPIMSNIDMYVHFWQAPYRILYGEDFTKMITGELEAEDFDCPHFVPATVVAEITDFLQDDENVDDEVAYLLGDGSIFDMLGYTKELASSSPGKINARKFIMYIRLCHDWYANENVEPWQDFLEDFDWKELIANADCSYIIAAFVVGCYHAFGTAGYLSHQWPKDYFTSALPTLQYGLPTYLPLGDSAPVSLDLSNVKMQGLNPATPGIRNQFPIFEFDGDVYGDESLMTNQPAVPSTNEFSMQASGEELKSIAGAIVKPDGTPIVATADLSEATAITVNELRISNALQVFKEREMRYGRKPQEYYRGFYGVTPGDLRLQMPKFLGGGKIPVNISDIEQTSQTTESSPMGRLAGKGTALAAGFARATTFAPEETLVLGVAWLMPHTVYSQTLSRHDTKLNDRFDYYNPSFAHIGEQPVWDYEIFAPYGVTPPKEFGYQPRYTEYRFHANEMHGEFKSSLSYWTLGRIFNSAPALNAAFIYMQPEALNRIFAVQKTAKDFIYRNVLASLYFQCAVIQPLSRYGTPGLMP